MQHLSEKPRPKYLKAQTECTRTGSNKTQAPHLRCGEEFCSFPPGGGRAALNEAALRRRSRGERLGWGGRACLRLPQTQRECSHASEDARPSSDTIARTHANHGWEPEAHGNSPEYATQGVDSIEEAAPVSHRAGRDERLRDGGECGAETERRW